MSKHSAPLPEKLKERMFRGKGIFRPLPTGRIDAHVSCIREYGANVFFYSKNGATVLIDAGYAYPRLREKMGWLGLDPAAIGHILITHQDSDHIGAVAAGSEPVFPHARLYLGEEENRYLTGEKQRRMFYGLCKLPRVSVTNPVTFLRDGARFDIDGIQVEAILVPGHTCGHLVYLIDEAYLFTGDTLWLGMDGGYSFINVLTEDNALARRSLAALAQTLRARHLSPHIITGHTGWTDSLDFAFAHIDRVCNAWFKQRPADPDAPYDSYDEAGDTPERARGPFLPKLNR